MSITVYTGSPGSIGAESITSGTGSTSPQVASASSIDPNTVRITFDKAMLLGYDLSAEATTLNTTSYRIRHIESGDYLPVLRAEEYSDSAITLTTLDQSSDEYEIECLTAQDAWGNEIDLGNNTASFTGTAFSHASPTALGLLIGGWAGIQYAEITGLEPDMDAPYVTGQDPAPSETGVLKDKLVYFELLDADSGIALTTVEIYILGALAYSGSTDTFSHPYDGVSSVRGTVTDGYSFTIDCATDWPSYTNVPVRVVAEDTLGNAIDTTYQFTIEDYIAPEIESCLPVGPEVLKMTNITYAVRDYFGVGIDPDSLYATVEGDTAILLGVFQSPFTGTITPVTDGYDISITKSSDYPSYAEIDVFVSAEDLNDNYNNHSWSFRIEDYVAPAFDTPFPPPSGVDIPSDTAISFNVTDSGGCGVDSSHLNVDITVSGTYSDVIINGAFQPGFLGSITPDGTGGFAVAFTCISPYTSFADVTVHCAAADLEGNTDETSWSFRIEDYLGVLTTDINPYPNATGVDRDANISFTLIDEQPIVLDSIKVEIDITGTGSSYVTAFEHEAFAAPFDGPLGIYDPSDPTHVIILIDPVPRLPKYQRVLVRVEAEDAEGNPIRM